MLDQTGAFQVKNRIHSVLATAGALLLVAVLGPLLAHAHDSPLPAAAGLFLVDRSDDDASAAAQVCSVAGNDCSLRGAIIKANANPGSTVVLFADQIYTLTIVRAGTDDATTGDLNVTADMTITTICFAPPCGPAIVQGAAGWNDRIFTVLGGQVRVKGLVVRGGKGGVYVAGGTVLTLTDSSVVGNHGTSGAGILNHGQLVLQNTQVVSNTTAEFGGGIYSDGYVELNSSQVISNAALAGGGLWVHKGVLALTDSDVLSNTAQGGGGGMAIGLSQLTMNGSRVLSNTAINGYGGGIVVAPTSTADIRFSQIGWNAGYAAGGGLFVSNSVLSLTNSTVFSNSTEFDGAGIDVEQESTAALINSTFSGNQARYNGVAIYQSNTLTTTLTNVTVAYNVTNRDGNNYYGGGINNSGSGGMVLLNSIVASNRDNGPLHLAPDCRGVLLSEGYNLIGDGTGCTISGDTTGNQLNVDPQLGPLRNNGGSTWTHALRFDSPAVDTASPLVCLVTDQRGALRPYNGSGQEFAWCDIGAFEYNGPQLRRLFLPLIRR